MVEVDGKTTVKFKDEIAAQITTNADGSRTYGAYTFTPNADGTFTYSVKNTEGETIDYIVGIEKGEIVTYTTNPVTINVGDGTKTDGEFKDSGYNVSNSVITNLLNGKIKVVDDNNGKTTVKFTDETVDNAECRRLINLQ